MPVLGTPGRRAFHAGFVSSLAGDPFDAAPSVLASHFLTNGDDRQGYFAEIARRLKPGGLLFNADLCADVQQCFQAALIRGWTATLRSSS